MSKQHPKSQPPEEPVQPDLLATDDDLVVVPKGQSRGQFLLILGLTIFVLLIFTVGDVFTNVVGGTSENERYFSWTNPEDGQERELDRQEFFAVKNRLNRMMEFGLYRPVFVEGQRQQKVRNIDVALWSVLDQIAADEGVEYSREEFNEHLRNNGLNDAQVKAMARHFAMAPRALMDDLYRGMHAVRVHDMLGGAAGLVADPAVVEERWKEQNPRYRFHLVSLSTEDFIDEAKASVPDDAALEEWFRTLDTFEQQQLWTEEKVRPSVAWLPLDEEAFDATALLERYPAPEGWDADVEAQTYYNRFTSVRFRAPEVEKEADEPETTPDEGEEGGEAEEAAEASDPAGEGEEAGEAEAAEEARDPAKEDEQEPERLYLEFDEVKDRAKRESELYRAMTAFLADLRARASAKPDPATPDVKPEPVDFLAEASALGLPTFSTPDAMGRAQFEAEAGWGGKQIATQLGFGQAGQFLFAPVVEPSAIVVARVDSKTARQEPPFAEIRDQVADKWATKEAADLALARLEGLREAMATKPPKESEPEEGGAESGDDGQNANPDVEPADDVDAVADAPKEEEPIVDADWVPIVTEEAFLAAVQAAGFEALDRGWLARRQFPNDDPAAASAGDRYIVNTQTLYDLEPGAVPAPAQDFSRAESFLVRYAGEKEPEVSEMKANELLALRQQLQNDSYREFAEVAFDPRSDWFKEHFKVYLRDWETPGEEAPVEEVPAGS